MRYHAKMKMGKEQTDILKIKIVLEEKPVEELFQKMFTGRTPPMLAYQVRKELVE